MAVFQPMVVYSEGLGKVYSVYKILAFESIPTNNTAEYTVRLERYTLHLEMGIPRCFSFFDFASPVYIFR